MFRLFALLLSVLPTNVLAQESIATVLEKPAQAENGVADDSQDFSLLPQAAEMVLDRLSSAGVFGGLLFLVGMAFGGLLTSHLEQRWREAKSNIRAVTPYDNVLLPVSMRKLDDEQAKTRFYRLLCLIAPDLDSVTPAALDSLLIQHLPGFCKYRRCLVDLFAYGYVDQTLRRDVSTGHLSSFADDAAARTGLQKDLVLWGGETWRRAFQHTRGCRFQSRGSRRRSLHFSGRSSRRPKVKTA